MDGGKKEAQTEGWLPDREEKNFSLSFRLDYASVQSLSSIFFVLFFFGVCVWEGVVLLLLTFFP